MDSHVPLVWMRFQDDLTSINLGLDKARDAAQKFDVCGCAQCYYWTGMYVLQKLHPEMLQMLGVRQAKVRHIPMHLHAKTVVLPEWTNGRNLFLSARLPAHFVQNMKWLKLKPPK